MYVLVPVCCFCEKVRDDNGTEVGQGPWMSLRAYRAKYHLLSGEMWFTHTCCADCMKNYENLFAAKRAADSPKLSM